MPRRPPGGGSGGGGSGGDGSGGGGNGGNGGGPHRSHGAGSPPEHVRGAQTSAHRNAQANRPAVGSNRPQQSGPGQGSGPGTGSGPAPSGPPWPVAPGTPGAANGLNLSGPHARHTVAGARSGMVRGDNTVALRGNEAAVQNDVRLIAEGRASWNPQTNRYEINGRSYGIESSGTVFPDSGAGLVKLDRVEYAALKEIARADGDVSASPALARDPKFTNNPAAVAKAKAIYDGTYP